MKLKQTFSAKKIAELLALYDGDKALVEAAATGGMGFANNANGAVILDLSKTPRDFLKLVLEQYPSLSDKQRNNLSLAYHGVSLDVDATLESAVDVANMISALRVSDLYNAEMRLMGRWYPVRVTAEYHGPYRGSEACTQISAHYRMVDVEDRQHWVIGESFFKDEEGGWRTLSGKQLFDELGLRHLQQDLGAFASKCSRAEAMTRHNGKIKAVTSDVLVREKERSFYYGSFFLRSQLGSARVPKKVVIESELEIESRSATHHQREDKDLTAMPFVRAFSLDLKRYCYVDIDDMTGYHFDKDALERLILPEREKGIITQLFTANEEHLFGDVLKDKHGGMIILAVGPTGTGKTLTAEVFAEITERPLYVMEMAELGIKVEEMEARLATIFRRVTKWGAVLLMDEADVFLAQRGESLERAVIVGIFLRLMDYYKGLLFLTTNRPEVIDPAFKSRITIQLDYMEHTPESRRGVWNAMLKAASISLVGSMDGLPDVKLNGRQIRNMVRLTKVLHGDRVTCDQIKEVCNFACK